MPPAWLYPMEVGGREFDQDEFLVHQTTGMVLIYLEYFPRVKAVNYRPSAPFLYEVASHVKNCHFGDYYYYYYIMIV